MKGFSRGDKGFTLIELLIVVAILGVLVAVVIPSVLGLMGRGASQAYNTDEKVIQLSVATFWSDTHAGWIDPGRKDPVGFDLDDPDTPSTYLDNLWSEALAETDSRHYYPTAIAHVSGHVLYVDPDVLPADDKNQDPNGDGYKLRIADGTALTGSDEHNAAIQAHAIWMGLLVNPDGPICTPEPTPTPCPGIDLPEGGAEDAAPLEGEKSLYLQEIPESSSAANGNPDPGMYTWVVGKNGAVYGAYYSIDEGVWYAGFAGSYP